MKKNRILLFAYLIISTVMFAQNAFVPSGGNGTGSGGSISYSTGQIACTIKSPCIEGIQQPVESLNYLPVELLSFDANAVVNDVELVWVTASEKDNDYFDIERSVDATNFEKIGITQGFGTKLIESNYLYIDENPLQGISYYRLRQVDYDGEFKYTAIRSVNFESDADLQINAWVDHSKMLKVYFDKTLNSDSECELVDMHGRVIGKFNVKAMQNTANYNVSALKPALYLVVVRTRNNVFTKKITITNN